MIIIDLEVAGGDCPCLQSSLQLIDDTRDWSKDDECVRCANLVRRCLKSVGSNKFIIYRSWLADVDVAISDCWWLAHLERT